MSRHGNHTRFGAILIDFRNCLAPPDGRDQAAHQESDDGECGDDNVGQGEQLARRRLIGYQGDGGKQHAESCEDDGEDVEDGNSLEDFVDRVDLVGNLGWEPQVGEAQFGWPEGQLVVEKVCDVDLV